MAQNTREIFKSLKPVDLRLIKQSENLQYLVNQSVSIYQTGPFLKLSFDEYSLKEYESLFQKKLPGCYVQFSTLSGIPYSLPSILIEVSEGKKTVYKSLLLTTSSMESTATLPLLLVLRPFKKQNINQVNGLIENVFECHVRPLILNEEQTFWLMGISLMESLRKRNKSALRIRCKLPIPIPSEVAIAFDEDSLAQIWDCLFDNENEILERKTVEMLFNNMYCHIKNTYGIDISTSPIVYFGLKNLYLQFTSEHLKMSIEKPEIIFMLLNYLISDCINV